ncbi:MAG TPA: radical SAM protein [Clostridiales bacterium]|nr:radical SAM protein [Clostridiales bacterium]
MVDPSYLKLLETGELEHRVEKLKNILEDCTICPHQCRVNRLNGERGYCRTLDKAIVSSYGPHFGEETELVGYNGSGAIFFSNCNLRCIFCQNYEISQYGIGSEVDSERLSQIMLHLQRQGCNNINLVSPSHVVPHIVEAIYLASQRGLNLPIVYNTNAYDKVSTLRFLDGIIDIYMPDIKFANDLVAYKYTGVKNYYSVAKAAVKEMYRQVGNLKTDNRNIAYRGLLIRHLVLPQNLAGTDKIMEFIANEISKDAYVNIMAQYYPAHRAYEFKELNRLLTRGEYEKAIESAYHAGLRNYKASM